MGFSTETTDGLWWLMVCPDTNAVRLALNLAQTGAWRDDLPRLIRGALGRQRRGRWDCTITNAWGALAVQEFSHLFEATPITGTSRVSLADAVRERAWEEPPTRIDFAFPWPAAKQDLSIAHEGMGAPWVTVESRAAIPLTAPLSSGYHVQKTVTPVEAREAGRFSRGDVLRVKLEVEAQSDMTWVVVSDPIPAGASHLGTGLARDTKIDADASPTDGDVNPAYVERAFEAFRAYYAFVPKGTFSVEYAIRLNQSGRFQLPTTRVEALYAPEMFGELPNATIEVAE